MANSDGSLKFDTQLDNSGFEKGADKIQRNLDSIKASAEQVNAASSRAAQAVAGQFQHMASDAPAAASAMLGINDAMKNIADGMGTSAGRSAAQMQSAAQQTAQAAQTLKSYLPDMFTSADFDKTLAGTRKVVTSLESQIGRLGDSIRRGFSTDAQVGKFDADIEKASGSVANLKAKLIALGKSQISTTEYDGLTKSILQAEQALFKLYDRRDVMEQLGTDKTSREWQRLAIQIENAEAELVQFERQKTYLESSGGAYTQKQHSGGLFQHPDHRLAEIQLHAGQCRRHRERHQNRCCIDMAEYPVHCVQQVAVNHYHGHKQMECPQKHPESLRLDEHRRQSGAGPQEWH